MATVTRKRHLPEDSHELELQPNKRRTCGDGDEFRRESTPTVIWSTRFGPSCLFGQAGPPAKAARVALFDLDGTLIKTKSGYRNPKDCNDWKWFSSVVPTKLKELVAEGYSIFITSNQLCPKVREPSDFYEEWKKKLEQVACKVRTPRFESGHTTPTSTNQSEPISQLDGVSLYVLAATQRDLYRKPLPGMWYAVQDLLKEQDIEVDLKNSFFVGDSAGREKGEFKNGETRDRDDLDTDAKFGQNIGLRFHTPEEFFLGESVAARNLNGFHPSQLRQDGTLFLPSSSPLVPPSRGKRLYMILLVGYPGVGKTTLYQKHFAPAGYVLVDKSGMADAFREIDKALSAGRSVVIEKGTQTKSERQDFLDYARKMKMEPRCITLGDYDLAQHNNIYRALCRSQGLKAIEGENQFLIPSFFRDFKAKFEDAQKDEGFKDMKKVFWQFDGSEEDRKRYMMWLQL
ncbi:hypothetical protein FRC15_007015 [Serendipita sp. 397]|nr:hypothetical protein FRC15_007015 [Serendipita sp. 397]